MARLPIYLLILTILHAGCSPPKTTMKITDPVLYQHALELAHHTLITDGHIDLPERLKNMGYTPNGPLANIPISSKVGDFDVERAKKGGLNAPFMSIFIPASYQADLSAAKKYADQIMDMVDNMMLAFPDIFGRGDSPEMIESNFNRGLISLPKGLENGAPITELTDVGYFYSRGVRYVTLTHAKDNHICDSSYDSTRTWNGLSDFGKQLIGEMNRTGMIIDVSHVSDSTFYQVMRLSKAPVLATHSSCRFFTPGWERNMNDDMIRLLASHEGVIQITFGSNFLDGEIAKNRKAYPDALAAYLQKHGIKKEDPSIAQWTEKFIKQYPPTFATVEHVANHIDHVVKLVGIDHVGLGSDFDGVGDTLPEGLKDVTGYPNIIYALLRKGYTDEDIEKICYKNVWRVWHRVNEIAGRS